jgi:heme A synthase
MEETTAEVREPKPAPFSKGSKDLTSLTAENQYLEGYIEGMHSILTMFVGIIVIAVAAYVVLKGKHAQG